MTASHQRQRFPSRVPSARQNNRVTGCDRSYEPCPRIRSANAPSLPWACQRSAAPPHRRRPGRSGLGIRLFHLVGLTDPATCCRVLRRSILGSWGATKTDRSHSYFLVESDTTVATTRTVFPAHTLPLTSSSRASDNLWMQSTASRAVGIPRPAFSICSRNFCEAR